jgi:hypothetical protein
MDNIDTGIEMGVCVAKRFAAIMRAVVDKDQFKVTESLPQDAVNARCQIVPTVIDGNDDADCRCGNVF